jgi:LPS export ABC transporter protein LptC
MINRWRPHYSWAILPLLWATSCVNDPNDIKALTGKGYLQEDRATDVTAIYSKEGKIKARLFAHQYIRNESAKPPFIDMYKGLKVEFYNDSTQIEHILTADSSRYYEAQGNVLVWGNVKIVSRNGDTLTTQELVWNQSIEKIYTEKQVRIATGTDVLFGNGLEANQDFTWYHITNPQGSVAVNKGEVPQ